MLSLSLKTSESSDNRLKAHGSRAIFALLLIILFIAPFVLGGFRLWASALLCLAIAVVSALHCAYAVATQQPLWNINKTHRWLIIPMLSCVFVVAMQDVLKLSASPGATRHALLVTVALTLYAVLLLTYCTSYQRLRALVVLLVITGLVQASYACILVLSPDLPSLVLQWQRNDKAFGSFTYQNFLANYLGLVLSLGVGLIIAQLSTGQNPLSFKRLIQVWLSPKLMIRLALMVMVIALILTRSRMGNAAFFIALALACLLALFFYRKPSKQFKWLIFSFFVLDFILIGALFGVSQVKERLSNTALLFESRDEVLRDAWTLLFEHPFLGHGAGSFYTVFPSVQQGPYSGYYDNAHNDYLQFLIELGWPASIALAVAIGGCLWVSVQVMKKRRTRLYQGLAFGAIAAIIFMLLHASVDYSLQAMANALTFITVLCIGLLCKTLSPPVLARN
ncbi:O-antigen ligase family protein [Pseudoalteromonas ruthenica]|uniref:O-antigen ligase family protein n=1 Tax=Pseudoalteromonas ruthenica TaxID=151081 RepID=UPI0009E4D91D|nr:O-antigen ligase family protein [Pseudoalteromonas ruthenica]TMO90254.1 O-antigen ligase family protein [Pseudoalteromonas ruthenica]TMO92042.1 O-antigen ligase family protein [Pseudoalteromonas ruthenica]TMO99575.1 O-antigen ligase family protein [Pseudoalteromonas ruthenica]TMP06676.1 O-antigen ligase family protein [Pseudoalteromonas ruthenica]TMP10938.1 O-antigen ligase family protein [Pseudoalteromonas ruthenica]